MGTTHTGRFGHGGFPGQVMSKSSHLLAAAGRMGPPLPLLQLDVSGLGGDENEDVGVGVFPLREEILIGSTGFCELRL